MIEFRSDNSAGVAPEILAAVTATNVGSAMAYGDDDVTEHLHRVVREVFEHPTARVFPVTSGTAANALALSASCPPWGSVLCHETAHILNSEGGATSMLSGGAVMRGVGGEHYRMAPAQLQAALDAVRWRDPHHSQPAVLSFTQPSDFGTVSSCSQISSLTEIARSAGLRSHLDGARFANALVALQCSPADMTWRAGIDVLSLGATKNGALSCEAIITFDDSIADELVYRTKRSGHVTSKMRFQSAQMIAYLTDDLWLRLAANSNDRMTQLAAGLRDLGVGFVNEPDVNMLFVRVSADVATALERDLWFYRMGPGVIRLVTSWQTTEADIDITLKLFAEALTAQNGLFDRDPSRVVRRMAELPPEDQLIDPHAEPEIVATHAHRGEAEVTKAHLAANGVDAEIIDGVASGMLPVEGQDGVLVMVAADQAEVARAFLADVAE